MNLQKPNTSSNDIVRPGLYAANKKNLPTIKQKLLSKVEKLSYKEIRRSRIPFHEAKIKELYEEGLSNSGKLLNQLITFEKTIKVPDGKIVPKLYKDYKLIDEIVFYLKQSELNYISGKIDEQIIELINLIKYLTNKTDNFNWLIEQLILITLNLAINYKIDGRYLESLVRYYYAKFCFENLKRINEAYDQLKLTRDLVIGKGWLMDDKISPLNKQLCLIYYQTLLELANSTWKTNKDRATKFIKRAIKMAEEADSAIGLAECYLQRGHQLLELKNVTEALENYKESITHAVISMNPESMCKAEYYISNCYKEMSNTDLSKKHIKILKRIATNNGLSYYIGYGNMLMGQVYMLIGKTKTAANSLIKSLEVFNELNMEKELRQARCLAAIAVAQEIITTYINIVLKSEKETLGSNEYMLKLIKWKDCREQFWTEDDLTNFNNVTTSTDKLSIDYTDKDNYDDEIANDETSTAHDIETNFIDICLKAINTEVEAKGKTLEEIVE